MGTEVQAMRNLVLTAVGGKVGDQPLYNVFLNTFARVRRPGTQLAVLMSEVSAAAIDRTRRAGAIVVPAELPLSDPGNKNRQWLFARYLAAHRAEYQRVVTVDARDTVFQRDPFDFQPADRETRLYFSAEPVRAGQNRWNKKDQYRLQRELRPALRDPAWRDFAVINGGFVAGDAAAMAEFQLVRFAVDMRDGKATDQATLTFLGRTLASLSGYAIVEESQPWIFHGHWFGQRVEVDRAVLCHDLTVLPAGNAQPYCMFHQWDRTPLANRLLQAYGHEPARQAVAA
jgi:hypothetical protein